MVDVDVEPQRVELLQHVAQLVGDAHGHENRHARADTHDLDVGYLAQAGEDLLEDLGCQHKRVATREQHIPHLGGVTQVFQLHLELSPREGGSRVTHDT